MADREANVVLTADTTQYQQQMVQSAESTTKVTESVVKLLSAVDRLTKRVGHKMEIVGAGTTAAIVAATVAAGRFEAQLETLQATSAITGRNMGVIQDGVDRLRRNLPVTTDQVSALATQLTKLGQGNPRNLERLAETFIKLSAATGEDLGSLTSGLIELQKIMGTGPGSTEKFANALTTLSARAGVSATGITQFSQAIAPVARTAGMAQTEVMAFSTAFSKAGQEGFLAANAFNQMLTNITRATRYGSPELAAYANVLGVTVEQFKGMDAKDQMLGLIEGITKAGPDGIKILERFGLEGARTQRALLALSQSGGLKTQLANAIEGFNGNDLNKGSAAAMDGFNDSLVKLRNNLTSIGQKFGEAFLEPMTKVVDGVTRMTSAFGDLFAMVSKVVAVAAGLTGAGGLIGGALVSNFAPIATAAGALMLLRNGLTSGFRHSRGTASGMDARMAASILAGGGGAVQRGLFGAGQRMGGLTTAIFGAPSGTGGGPNVFARGAMLGSAAASGLLQYMRMSVDPARWGAIADPTSRNQMFQQRMNERRQQMFDARHGPMATARGAFNNQASFGRAAGNLLNNMSRFGLALTSATLGLTRLAAVSTLNATARVGASMVSGIGNFIANHPILTAAAVGYTGYSLYKSNQEKDKNDLNEVLEDSGENSFLGQYNSALGLATRSTLSFADALRQAENSIPVENRSDATSVRGADVRAALTPGRKFTNTQIADMSGEQATAFLSSLLSDEMGTPNEVLQAAKLDIIQRFGDPETAKKVISNAKKADPYEVRNRLNWGEIERDQQLTVFGKGVGTNPGLNDENREALKLISSELKIQSSAISEKYNQNEGSKFRSAAINQLVLDGLKNTEAGSPAVMVGILRNIVEGQLGGKLNISDDEVTELYYNYNRNGERAALKYFQDEILGDTQRGKNYLTDSRLANVDLFATSYAPPDDFTGELSEPEKRIRRTAAGQLVRGDTRISRLVQSSVNNEGDVNLQIQAGQALAAKLKETAGSSQGAIDALQQLKAAVNDVDDPLYRMADAAQQFAVRLQNIEMMSMTRGEQAGVIRQRLQSAYEAPDSPTYQQDVLAAEEAYEEQRASAREFFAGVVKAYREFDISRQRMEEDFTLQRSRAQEDFDLQKKYSTDDFYLSQRRSQEDFAIQRSRADYDYNLQRAHAFEDFNLQRERGEYDYHLQRKHAQEDFNISRRRAEEDFQRQVMLMTENTARSMSNVYERMTVQRTWSASNLAQNLRDQNDRLGTQTRQLDQLRSAGLSDAAINALGLNDPQQAQQVARLFSDLMNNPEMIKTFNESIASRYNIAKAFVTDESSASWREVQHQFNLMAERAAEDFTRAMKRGEEAYVLMNARMADDFNRSMRRGEEAYNRAAERMGEDFAKTMERGEKDFSRAMERNEAAFKRSMSRSIDDFEKQMDRAQADINRSFEEITGTFEDLSTQALSRVSGHTNQQLGLVRSALLMTRDDIRATAAQVKQDIDNVLAGFGVGKFQLSPRAVDHRMGYRDQGTGGANSDYGAAGGGGGVGGGGPISTAAPVMGNYRLSSGFGPRKSPGGIGSTNHQGLDMAAPIGTGVTAARPGVVTFAGLAGGYGNLIKVDHGGGIETRYAHLSAFNVKPGDMVQPGMRIGAVGSTGISTGPHLHFEVRVDGKAIDPTGFLKGAANLGDVGGSIAQAIRNLPSLQKLEQLVAQWEGLSKAYPPGSITEQIVANATGQVPTDMIRERSSSANMGGTYARNKQLGQSMAASMKGWTGSQWDALLWLWEKESNWNNLAQNPRSSAFGIAQFLDATWKTVGGYKTADPGKQIDFGMRYIDKRYGDPIGAKRFWEKNKWYGEGSIFTGPQTIGVGERGPEAVLPLNARGADFMAETLSKFVIPQGTERLALSKGAPCHVDTIEQVQNFDQRTQFQGEWTVVASDPMEFQRKMEEKRRYQALIRPAGRTP